MGGGKTKRVGAAANPGGVIGTVDAGEYGELSGTFHFLWLQLLPNLIALP